MHVQAGVNRSNFGHTKLAWMYTSRCIILAAIVHRIVDHGQHCTHPVRDGNGIASARSILIIRSTLIEAGNAGNCLKCFQQDRIHGMLSTRMTVRNGNYINYNNDDPFNINRQNS